MTNLHALLVRNGRLPAALKGAWNSPQLRPMTKRFKCACVELGTLLARGKTVYYVRDNGAGFGTKYAGK